MWNQLEDNVIFHDSQADRFALEAEQKSDFTLLGRSNDLRKLVILKKTEIEELQKMETELLLLKESTI